MSETEDTLNRWELIVNQLAKEFRICREEKIEEQRQSNPIEARDIQNKWEITLKESRIQQEIKSVYMSALKDRHQVLYDRMLVSMREGNDDRTFYNEDIEPQLHRMNGILDALDIIKGLDYE